MNNRRIKTLLALIALAVLAAVFALHAFAQTPAPTLDDDEARSIHMESVKLFSDGQFEDARKRFQEILLRFPESSFAADATFKIGECHYRQEQYLQAGRYFKLYVERFGLGRNIRDAKIRLAQCEEKVGEKIAAAHPKMELRRPAPKVLRPAWFHQKSLADLEREIAEFARQGVNTLLVPAFLLPSQKPHRFIDSKARKGAYFRSDHIDSVTDLLPQLAVMAHKYDLRLWVEFPVAGNPFCAQNRAWDPVEGRYVQGKGADIFAEETLNTLTETARDLAGISLDGLVFTELGTPPLQGFSQRALDAYHETGWKGEDPSELFKDAKQTSPGVFQFKKTGGYPAVATVRARQLSDILRNLIAAVKGVNPNIEIWFEAPQSALSDPAEGIAQYGLDVEMLGSLPSHGFVMPMELHNVGRGGSLTQEALSETMTRLLKEALVAIGDPGRLIFSVDFVDPVLKKKAPDWQLEMARDLADELKLAGFMAGPLRLGFDYSILFMPHPVKPKGKGLFGEKK